jgi:hypothetical protein
VPVALDTIVATLRADTGQHDAALRQSGQVYDNLGQRSTRSAASAAHGMRNLQHSVLSLALSSVEVDHNVGRLVSTLLLLGAGSTAVLGIAAGIAAVAAAYRLFTAAAREAEEQQKKFVESLEKAGPHAQLLAARMQLAAAQEQVAAKQRQLADLDRPGAFATGISRRQLEVEIAKLQIEIANITNTKLIPAARAAAEAFKAQDEVIYKAAVDAERLTAALEHAALASRITAMGGLGALKRQSVTGPTGLRGGGPPIIDIGPEELDRITGDIDRVIADSTREASPMVEQMGRTLGHVFADALINGIQDFQDIFKSILGAFLEAGISYFIKTVFPPLAGAGPLSGSVVQGGAQFSVVAPPLPQMIHPYDAARMAEWQQLYRETALVANSQGFRAA